MIRSTIALLAVCLALPLLAYAQVTKPKPQPDIIHETAATFLAQAEKRIYQPAHDGLESLAFKVNRVSASGKSLWSINVKWNSTTGATIEGSVSESAPFPPALKSQIEAAFPRVGEVFVSEQTGRFLTYLQSVATPTLDGFKDGFVRVSLSPKEGANAGFAEKVLLFDNEHVLRKARTTQKDGVTLVETYRWRALKGDSPQLLLKSVTAGLKVRGMDITRVTTYDFTKVDRWYLFTRQDIATSGIPKSPTRHEALTFSSFVVNGKPIKM